MDAHLKTRGGSGFSTDWDNLFRKSAFDSQDAILRALAYRRKQVKFCTGSSYTGKWNPLGMAVYGSYIFPQGCEYEGEFVNGRFHGEGTISYPMGQKLDGLWYKGKMMAYSFWHIDGMIQDESWPYCRMPDRRFNVSIHEGLRPAGREFLTNQQPTRPLDSHSYDTGDGYFDTITKTFVLARDPEDYVDLETRDSIEVIQVSDEEADDYLWINRLHTVPKEREDWIKEHCRKGWDEPVGYRPQLYPVWCTGRQKEAEEIDLKFEREEIRTEKLPSDSQKSGTCDLDPEALFRQMHYAGTGRKLVPSSRSSLFIPPSLYSVPTQIVIK